MSLSRKFLKTLFVIIVSGFLTLLFFGDEKIKKFLFSNQFREKLGVIDKEGTKVLKKVLGQATEEVEKVDKWEVFHQTKNKVEETVDEAARKIKNLPEEKTQELKRQIKNQICQEWLKEE